MKHYVYILQSISSGRYYCGQTRDLQVRLAQHNAADNDLAKTTKRFPGPWELLWCIEVPDGKEAVRLERKIKKRGIARFLKAVGSGC